MKLEEIIKVLESNNKRFIDCEYTNDKGMYLYLGIDKSYLSVKVDSFNIILRDDTMLIIPFDKIISLKY